MNFAFRTVRLTNVALPAATRRLPTLAVAAARPQPLYRTYSSLPDASQDPKLSGLVDQISKLTLLETASLVALLKTRLNIQDIAAPVMAAPVAASGAAAPAAEEKPPEKTEFTVKLEKFDAASKAKVIREIKGLLPGANLVEAKKFVESAPKVIREKVPKEEAEKIKATLEAVGATVLLE